MKSLQTFSYTTAYALKGKNFNAAEIVTVALITKKMFLGINILEVQSLHQVRIANIIFQSTLIL